MTRLNHIVRELCVHCRTRADLSTFRSLEHFLRFEVEGLCQECQDQISL